MRIVLLSDTHNLHERVRVPDGDILIHAGDFTLAGNPDEVAEAGRWFRGLPHKYKVAIAGNHDRLFDEKPELARELFVGDSDVIYLENSGAEVCGFRIWGSPITPEFCNWAFNVERGEAIKHYWDMIPPDTDILVTHGPPMGILDQSVPGGPWLGCEMLRDAMNALSPGMHVFGHIHGGHGFRMENGIRYCNASIVDEAYRLVNGPHVWEVPSESL